ncbi:hypothetical protein Tco_0709643 [Tanacetum coccineum]
MCTSNPVTSNSVPTTSESKVMENDKVTAPGMFRIDPRKTSREDKVVPINKFRASIRTNPITISQPHVITKNNVKSKKMVSLLMTLKALLGPEDHSLGTILRMIRSLLSLIFGMLNLNLYDVCVLNYVNDMNSRALNKNANVSNVENQNKQKPKVWKPKKVGSEERLASPKPSTPRSYLRWSPTGRIFDLKGKIIATSKSECQSDYFKGFLTVAASSP